MRPSVDKRRHAFWNIFFFSYFVMLYCTRLCKWHFACDASRLNKLIKNPALSLVAVRRLLRWWWRGGCWTGCCSSWTTRVLLATTHWTNSKVSSPTGSHHPSGTDSKQAFYLKAKANNTYLVYKPCLSLPLHIFHCLFTHLPWFLLYVDWLFDCLLQ